MDYEVRLPAACQSCPGLGYAVYICRIENPSAWELGLYFSLGKEMNKVVPKTGSLEWCLIADKILWIKNRRTFWGRRNSMCEDSSGKGLVYTEVSLSHPILQNTFK